MNIRCTSQRAEMVARLEDLAVRVRDGGLVAELIHGPSYPLLVVRLPSPIVVRVMAGSVHYWWYGDNVYPIAPVDDPANVAHHIVHRAQAAGGRP